MLVLSRADKLAISDLITYAKKRVIKIKTKEDLQRLSKEGNLAGDDPHRVVHLRAGKARYRVAYSVEDQNIGLVRHLSLSSTKVRLEDVNDILKKFDFRGTLTSTDARKGPDLFVWWESSPMGPALNVLEQMEDGAVVKTVGEAYKKVESVDGASSHL